MTAHRFNHKPSSEQIRLFLELFTPTELEAQARREAEKARREAEKAQQEARDATMGTSLLIPDGEV